MLLKEKTEWKRTGSPTDGVLWLQALAGGSEESAFSQARRLGMLHGPATTNAVP